MSNKAEKDASVAMATGDVVKVLFPLPLPKPYDYRAPPGVEVRPGAFVRAPLGPRLIVGVVWSSDGGDGARSFDPARLKSIEAVLDAPPLSPAIIDFVSWVSDYTLSSLGAVLRLVMRSGDALAPVRPIVAYRSGDERPPRVTPARQAVLDVIEAASAPMTVMHFLKRM